MKNLLVERHRGRESRKEIRAPEMVMNRTFGGDGGDMTDCYRGVSGLSSETRGIIGMRSVLKMMPFRHAIFESTHLLPRHFASRSWTPTPGSRADRPSSIRLGGELSGSQKQGDCSGPVVRGNRGNCRGGRICCQESESPPGPCSDRERSVVWPIGRPVVRRGPRPRPSWHWHSGEHRGGVGAADSRECSGCGVA